MKFKFWKELSEEEKEKLLKRICYGAAILFVIIFILFLMKCQGCSEASARKRRNFSDGRGHSYGEEIDGAGIFDKDYGQGAEVYNSLSTSLDDNEKRLKNERAAEEAKKRKSAEVEEMSRESEEEKLSKAQSKKAAEEEKKRRASEEKKKVEEEKKIKAAEEKQKAEEEKKEKRRRRKSLHIIINILN